MNRKASLLGVLIGLVLTACSGSSPAASSDGSPIAASPSETASADLNVVEPGKLTIATTGNAPPFSLTSGSGELQGFDIDVCGAIADELGLEAVFVTVPFPSALPGLNADRFDMVCAGLRRTAERLASTDLSMTDPYAASTTTMLARASDSEINSLEDCVELRIAAVQGSTQAQDVETQLGVSAELYPGISEEILDLQNDRVDCVATDELIGGYYVTSDDSLKLLSPGINHVTVGAAVRIAAPDVLAAVNQAIEALIADGTVAAAQQEWFGHETPLSE